MIFLSRAQKRREVLAFIVRYVLFYHFIVPNIGLHFLQEWFPKGAVYDRYFASLLGDSRKDIFLSFPFFFILSLPLVSYRGNCLHIAEDQTIHKILTQTLLTLYNIIYSLRYKIYLHHTYTIQIRNSKFCTY